MIFLPLFLRLGGIGCGAGRGVAVVDVIELFEVSASL